MINLMDFVEYHTMTVALISKHLRVSGISPTELYRRFQETEGSANTGDDEVTHIKDRHIRIDSVNAHLEALFSIIGLDSTEKELLGSLSLLSGIRMKKSLFSEICHPEQAEEKLNGLIMKGWVEYNEMTDKISLHQVIQDVIEGDVEHVMVLFRHKTFVYIRIFNFERQLNLINEHIVAF